MPTRIHFKGPLTSTLLICCAFIILGLFAIQNEFASTRQKSAQELRLIAEVKAYTLANWLRERSGDAQIIRNSRQINTAYRKWMERGDRTAKAEAQARLLEFLNAYNYQAALIADEDGHLLLSVGDPHLSEQEILPPPLLQAIKRAASTGRVENTDLYPQEENANHAYAEHVFFDLVAQLQTAPGETPYFIVLRIDAHQFIFPFILTWPTQSDTGELLLVRQTADGPIVMNPVRDATFKPFLFSPYARNADADPNASGDIVKDYRGEYVLRTIHSHPELPWQIAIKEDIGEVYSRSLRDIGWIVLSGLLMMLTVAIANYLRHQRLLLAQSAYDNTLQKRQLSMQHELHESTQRFIDIARSSPDWIWETDAEGARYTYVSENVTRALGYLPSELIGQRPVDMIESEDEKRRIQARLADLRADRQPIENLEYWQQDKNGKRHLIQINGVPIIGEDDSLLGYRGTGRDITAQHNKENQVAQLSRAVEQGMNGILITDLNHTIEYVNDAYCALVGYSRDELIGGVAGSLNASGETPAATYQALQNELLAGRVWRGTFHNRRKNGDLHLDAAVISPIRDRDGHITHYVGIFEDITEREQQREELIRYREHLQELVDERTQQLETERGKAESMEKLLREAVESISQGFVLLDQNDRLVLCNSYYRNCYHQMADMLVPGVSFTDILKTSLERDIFAIPHDDQEAWMAARMAAHCCSDARPHEYQLRDGRWMLTMEFRTPSGYYVGNRVDITEHKNNEILLAEARDAANAANQAKSLFLANMSHEIRSPMNAIIGLSYLCLKTDLPAKSHDYVSKIQKSATLLLGIINDILDFSKVEAGKLTIERTAFVLEEVVEHSVSLYSAPLAERGIDLKIKIAPDVPGHLYGDPLRLGQVLTNLLGNASKFTQKGQIELEVVLSPSRPTTAAQTKLMFSVRDTGVGMTPEQQGRLFQVFSQADNTITRRFGGTGLGLTISRELVELMGGRISVESSLGHGTCFSFSLPFDIDTDTGPLVEGQVPQRVLVVDDEAMARSVLGRLLEKMGYEVVQANSGQEALDCIAASERQFSIIFMDWKMPGMDGFQTTTYIRQRPAYAETPIIMVTAGELSEIESMCAPGVDSYLFKPVSLLLLKDALANLQPRQEDKAASAATEIPELAGKRLLLVEDNEFNQIVARDLLELLGAQVDIANNGQEALEALPRNAYDLVLMDMQMPVMDGLTATREIRRQQRFAHLPIIAMTANALQGEKDLCLAAGMDDFISKPIDPDHLRENLVAWLNGERQPLPRAQSAAEEAGANGETASQPPTTAQQDSFDLAIGLAFVKGRTPLYLKLLDNFLSTKGEFIEQLRQGMHTGDVQLVMRIAHTLRGISGTLGASKLTKAAKALEDQLKAGVDVAEAKDASAALEACLQQAILDAETVKNTMISEAAAAAVV